MKTMDKQSPAGRTKDLTEGSPLRLILAFALPLLIGNVFQQIYTMADTMILGRVLGESAIAAVGATAALYSLLIDFAIGLNSGYGIVAARLFGARNKDGLRRAVGGMAALNLFAAAALTGVSLLFLRPLLQAMNTPAGIFDQAHLYIAILCGGMAATICYNMFAAILRAAGDSRSPLYFLILSCVVNVGLDLLLTGGLGWGVAGAAAATVAAQSVSALLCGWYIVKRYPFLLPKQEDFRQMRMVLPDLLFTGLAMALMMCVVDLGSTIFQRAANRLGETYIAAHAAARRMMGVLMQPLSSVAAANSAFAGQNWGAGKEERVRAGLRQAVGLELIWAFFACGMAWLFGRELIEFVLGVSEEAVLGPAVLSLRWHLTFFPVLAVLLCLRTAMQAAGAKTAPVLSSCIELAMKVFAAWQLTLQMGFLGVCVTEPITWVLMTVFLTGAYGAQSKKRFARAALRPCSASPQGKSEPHGSQVELRGR